MELGNQILFFLAGLGVFNGLLLALYFLFFIKPRKWVNALFGLMVLMLCIRIGKSLFFVFMDVPRIYRQIGLSACIMVGPLLYLYVRSLLKKVERPGGADWLHLLLPLGAITIVGALWPYETHPDFWNQQVVTGIYAVWIVYTIASCRLVIPLLSAVFKRESTVLENWLLLVVSCMLLLCVVYNLAYYGFPYVSGPLLFSAVFYLMTGFLISRKNRSVILRQDPVKYQNQKISDDQADALLRRLANVMDKRQIYLHQKIKLAQLAESVDATPHEVSQVINDRLGISFNQYINEYRVRKACILLREIDHLTIEGIGQEVGFNSRSAFYKAFKEIKQQTPSEFKAGIKQSMS